MTTNRNSRRLLCVSGTLAFIATGLIPCAASAAHDIDGVVMAPDGGIIHYTVTCENGDQAFNDFDLKIDPGDVMGAAPNFFTTAYTAGALPNGWDYDRDANGNPKVVKKGENQFFVRLVGPALACPGSYLFDLHHSLPVVNNNVGAQLTVDEVVIHEQCVIGWAQVDLWPKVPTVSEWGLFIMTLLALTAGTIVFARRRRPAVA